MKTLGSSSLVFFFTFFLVSSKKEDLNSHTVDDDIRIKGELSHSSKKVGATKRVTRLIKNSITGLVHAPFNILSDFFINGLQSEDEKNNLLPNAQVDHYHIYFN
jgi:hypothetical protein